MVMMMVMVVVLVVDRKCLDKDEAQKCRSRNST